MIKKNNIGKFMTEIDEKNKNSREKRLKDPQSFIADIFMPGFVIILAENIDKCIFEYFYYFLYFQRMIELQFP